MVRAITVIGQHDLRLRPATGVVRQQGPCPG